jgi:hypothetical protein
VIAVTIGFPRFGDWLTTEGTWKTGRCQDFSPGMSKEIARGTEDQRDGRCAGDQHGEVTKEFPTLEYNASLFTRGLDSDSGADVSVVGRTNGFRPTSCWNAPRTCGNEVVERVGRNHGDSDLTQMPGQAIIDARRSPVRRRTGGGSRPRRRGRTVRPG